MKKFFFLIIAFNLLFNFTAHSYESYIVYKVNNKIITNIDIENEYRYLIALNENLKNINKQKIIRLAKESIIKEKIKKTEIDKYFDLSKENKLIDRIIEDFYNKLGMQNKNEFKNYLVSYNLLYEDVKYKIAIEAAWNDLVYKKYSRSIEIDKKKIENEINKLILENKKQNVYLISEILFAVDKSKNINTKYEEIKKTISEHGFKNAANLHSISDSSKLGGQVGWVNENQISEFLKKEIAKLDIGEYSKPIPIPSGLLIIKLDEKKIEEEKLDFKKEYNKKITFEKNSQLDTFSKIYYKKIKKNSVISEY